MEYIYGALLLHKLGQAVSESTLSKVVEAAGVPVDDSKVKTLVASLQGVDIASELENASVVTATATGAAGGAAESGGDTAGKEEKAEKKQEEKKEESAAGLASLFG